MFYLCLSVYLSVSYIQWPSAISSHVGNSENIKLLDRAGGRTPVPPVGGGLMGPQWPDVTYENFFLVFLMFSTAPIRQNPCYATESCS